MSIPAMSDDTMPVVHESEVLDQAYQMGFDRFADAPADGDVGPYCEAVTHFKEMATFINSVAPRLRAMSGMDDSMGGTYQVDRDVVVIPVHADGDRPAEGIVMSARVVYRAAQDAWDRGAHDALQSRDFGATDDIQLTA